MTLPGTIDSFRIPSSLAKRERGCGSDPHPGVQPMQRCLSLNDPPSDPRIGYLSSKLIRFSGCLFSAITSNRKPELMTSTTVNALAAHTDNLSKVYGQKEAAVVALDGVSIGFESGRFTAVMGPSGSGKSTLMHCVAGLDNPSGGSVFIGDTEIGRLNDKELTLLRRDRIGFVFQSFNLIPTLTADENILLPLSIAGRKPDSAWYDLVITITGLKDRLSHKPSELSGGQQQRVACARALMSKPDIIFADEPTGNLDSKSGAEVLGFLRNSVDEFQQTIVMVTHDPVAASYTDRVIFLADGRVVNTINNPTRDSVLQAMGRLEPGQVGGSSPTHSLNEPTLADAGSSARHAAEG